MWPTLLENDLVQCDYFFLGRRRIERNDIVAFKAPAVDGVRFKARADFHVKRVIGMPGDRVEVIPAVGVSVNGQIVNEQNYVANKADYELKCLGDIGGMLAPGESVRPYFLTDRAAEPIIVPPHHYFLLGDNRNTSVDSHIYGFVDERLIRARVRALRNRDLRAKQIRWNCTFCGSNQTEVNYLLHGLGGYICTSCLSTLCVASAQIPEATARCTLCLNWRDAKQIRFNEKLSGGRACAECIDIAVEAQLPFIESQFESGEIIDFDLAISQARSFLHFSDYDRALRFARMAAEQKPDDARALTALTNSLIASGRAEEAVTVARRACELDAQQASATLLLAEAFIELKKLDEALAACNAVLERHPANTDAYGVRSVIHIRDKKFKEALTDARRVLADDPDDAAAHANVAYCQLELGNVDEATFAIDRALYCNVRLPAAYRTRARIRMSRGQHSQAIEDFSIAIKLAPRKGEYYALRASAYEHVGEKALAENDLQKARDLGWREESATMG